MYTYGLVAGGSGLLLDLGFGIRRDDPLAGLEAPVAGMVVTSHRQKAEAGVGYRFTPLEHPPPYRYTFGARVERVIDGDTLLVSVDCGFHTSCVQRLRLRGIDTPELGTVAGRRAKQFVEEELAQVAGVVVATHRTDRYGRYVADVCYGVADDVEAVLADGRFLNEVLLEEGLALPYI